MAITPVSQMVAEAKSEIDSLPPEVAQEAASGGRALLVDIRDIRELERDGRVPGAMHVPRGMLEFWVDPASPYHKPALADGRRLVLFCASSWRSALSARTLRQMGLADAAEIEGGFKAWKAAGLPVEEGAD